MGESSKKVGRYKCLLLLLSVVFVSVLFLTTSAYGAEPSYNMVAGYSADLDTSVVDSVSIEKTASGEAGHYNIYVYIDKDYEASMSGGSVYNYYSLSEFLPSYDEASGKYGSFYATRDSTRDRIDSVTNKKTLCYVFHDVKYTGEKGIFAFRVMDGLKRSYGPFTYTVDPSFLEQPTVSNPFTTGDNQVPVTPQDNTSSEKIEIASLKPHLLVDSYSFGGNQVTAGQEFDLSFTLKNFSKKDLRNVIVKVTPGDGVSILKDSNLFYYDSIGAGKTLTQTVRCKLSLEISAEVQSTTIETDFQYYDKKDQDPVTGGDSIILSIPTGKINRAKITSITIPKDFKQDKEGNVEYGFINNGFAKIYNAEVFIYDEAGKELYWNFIGTVEPGTKASTEKIPLKFAAGGEQQLKLVVQYEEENLATKSMEKSFVVPVKSTDTSDSFGMDMGGMGNMNGGMDMSDGFESMGEMGNENSGGGVNIFLIIGGVALLALIAFFVIRKILKKRKANYDDFYEAFPEEKKAKKSKDALGSTDIAPLLETKEEDSSSKNGDDPQ